MSYTVKEIEERLACADAEEFAVLERSLKADVRKGVHVALDRARRRLEAADAEQKRIEQLYDYQASIAHPAEEGLVVGLDEVGRGPLAGPLAVGAVVLPDSPRILGLNDSKQIKHEVREELSQQIKDTALAWAVCYIEPGQIDMHGMTWSLRSAFSQALKQVEDQLAQKGLRVGTVLLDGNPLRLDDREVNVIKGDAKCASISAASIIAKVDRDALMVSYAAEYPEYDLASCKGYASPAHIQAIKDYGLTPIHRASFCGSFTQQTLF